MDRSKQLKTYAITAALGLAATIGLFAYEGASTAQADAKGQSQSTSLKVARIDFGTKISTYAYTSVPNTISERATLSGIKDSNLSADTNFAYVDSSDSKKNKYALQLGLDFNFFIFNFIEPGSITFNFSSFSYQSIRINVKANENKTVSVNKRLYPVTTAWSDIDIYNCGVNSSDPLTITSTIGSDPFTWISSIELHYKG